MNGVDEITDTETQGVESRRLMGIGIASTAKIELVDGLYLVPSVTSPRPTKYKVFVNADSYFCDCMDFKTRGCKCKHVFAVEYMLQQGEKLKVNAVQPRKTYPQKWSAYNAAQQNEKRDFQTLLADLCKGIVDPSQDVKSGRGRPAFPLNDAVFSAVYKVYSTFSGRRFTSDLCDAQAKGLIGKVPHYNTVFKCIEKPELFTILVNLIERASLPLKSVEKNFAVDSTGFAYSRFVRWYDIKYNRFTAEKQWVKAHFMTGVNTNVVTSIEIHGRDTGDALCLPSLLESTAKNFTVKELSADKGYAGRDNFNAIAKHDVTPYIMFKDNTTGGVGGMFEKAWHYFSLNRDEFLKHYHQRSNIESTVMMIKTKFGDAVRSKSEVAAKNEVLCKVLCHNICCLISAMYEMGIQPSFDGQ